MGTNGQIPGMAGAPCGQGSRRHLDLGKAEAGAHHKAGDTCAVCAPWNASRSADKPVVEDKLSTEYQHSGRLYGFVSSTSYWHFMWSVILHASSMQ